ncbi:flagellar hook assembly protein FlgD [Pseudogracilibacillus sp. SE30717A]|uniref:flagellar hook assembly protein FlgD n=1 Tax=Pseudogracilibacillus sp. SE30717A TaxID=3098293 RepID=UPI00300E5D21
MNKIDPSLYLSNQSIDRTPNPNLGKDEFIKILMTQLQNQDPLNPMDDKEFIAQMATFSQLEQMMYMARSIDMLVENQLVSPVIQYSHMIGKEVTYQMEDEETGEKKIVTSTVIAVSQKDGWAILELENGEEVYADGVMKVNDPKKEETPDE